MTTLADHYDALLARDRFERPAVGLGGLEAAEVRRRFVAADGDPPGPTRAMVTTGVGATGPPHLGTLAQVRTAITLQRAGYDVQFVVADYEPYAGGLDRGVAADRADRYVSLVESMGFDRDAGVLRTQTGTATAREAMERAFLLAPDYDPGLWNGDDAPPTAFERAVSDAYERRPRRDEAGPASDAAAAMSGALHLADFLLPLTDWGYDRVLLSFGADEYDLLPAARRLRKRAGVDGRLAGVYTRLIPGLDGAPKMSKSLPGTGLDLSTPPAEAERRIRALPGDGEGSPAAATLALLSDRDAPLPPSGTEERAAAIADLATDVAALARRWRDGDG